MENVYQHEDMIKVEIGPNEEFLWAGRPRQGIVLRAIDAIMIPFSVLWCGIPAFIAVVIILSDTPLLALILTPLALAGLYLVFGRFITDARRRERTYYGISAERIIIISGRFNRKVKTLNLDTLTDLSMTERPNGSGTITFGPTNPWQHWFGAMSWPGTGGFVSPQFEMVGDVKSVYEIIRQAQRASKQSQGVHPS